MSISQGTLTRAIVFVKIELTGLTLRFATEDVIAKDMDGLDYFWEGRVFAISDLSSGFNDFRESFTTVSNLAVTLANGKTSSSESTLDAQVNSYFWGKRKCTVFLETSDETQQQSSGSEQGAWKVGPLQFMGPQKRVGSSWIVTVSQEKYTLTSSSIIFKGEIGFPNVFESYTDTEIAFSVYDSRYSDQKLSAPNVFQGGTISSGTLYDGLADGLDGRPIPVVYGDYSDAANVPAYNVSGYPFQTLRSFKITDSSASLLAAGQYALLEVGDVLLNDESLVASEFSNDLSNGAITLDTPKVYEGVDCYVSCQGKTRGTQIALIFGGIAGTILNHPVEVVYDLLTLRLSTDTTDIDSASFVASRALCSDAKCRRIMKSTSLVEEIDLLCFEFGLELYSLLGKFYMNFQSISGTASTSLSVEDIDGENGYQVFVDPNRSYFNKFTARYNDDPKSGDLLSVARFGNEIQQRAHATSQDFEISFKWAYLEVDVIERLGFLLYIYSKPIRQIALPLRQAAWDLKPGDVFALTFHIFSSQTFRMRSVRKSFEHFGTYLTAWDMGSPLVKVWLESIASAPTTYAGAVSSFLAVWHADFEISSHFNDSLRFVTDAPYTASIATGVYESPAALATAIQTAMNAVSIVRPLTVVYNSSTRKFTIATVGATNFSLSWNTPGLDEPTAELAQGVLGFDASADDTGAATYTSDYICIFDTVEGEAVSVWG